MVIRVFQDGIERYVHLMSDDKLTAAIKGKFQDVIYVIINHEQCHWTMLVSLAMQQNTD